MAFSLNPVKAAIAPYLMWIKAGIIIIIFLGGTFTGCQIQEKLDAKVLRKSNAALLYYRDQAQVSATALANVNKQYKANKQAAEEWKDRAEDAAKTADAERKANDKKQTKWEQELEKAKRDPNCKAIMEMQLCKTLTDY